MGRDKRGHRGYHTVPHPVVLLLYPFHVTSRRLGLIYGGRSGMQYISYDGLFVELLDEVVMDGFTGKVVSHKPGYHRIKPADVIRYLFGGPLPHSRESN